MGDFLVGIITGGLFPLRVQQGGVGLPTTEFLTTTTIDPQTLLLFLGGLITIILLIVFAVYKFNKWKKYKVFEDEMRSLDLDPEQEGTFADMVRRYSMDEPVNIIYSPRLFDEMATQEMMRVLGSPGSSKAKREFIDTVYKIRVKTYNPDWDAKSAEAKAEVDAA